MFRLLLILPYVLFLSYHLALSAVNKLFGAKAHKKFPRKIRLAGNGCYGLGIYPSSGGSEYWAKGIDVEIKVGKVVCLTDICTYSLSHLAVTVFGI